MADGHRVVDEKHDNSSWQCYLLFVRRASFLVHETGVAVVVAVEDNDLKEIVIPCNARSVDFGVADATHLCLDK